LPGPSTLYLSNVRLRVVVANPIVDRRLSTGPVEIIPTDADVLGIAVNPPTHAIYALGNNRANAGELNIINGPAGPRFCPAVYGAIGDKYRELGGCDGSLGKAVSPEVIAVGGRGVRAQHVRLPHGR